MKLLKTASLTMPWNTLDLNDSEHITEDDVNRAYKHKLKTIQTGKDPKNIQQLLEAYRTAIDIIRSRKSAYQSNTLENDTTFYEVTDIHPSISEITPIEVESTTSKKKKSPLSNWILGGILILIIKNIASISNCSTESNDDEIDISAIKRELHDNTRDTNQRYQEYLKRKQRLEKNRPPSNAPVTPQKFNLNKLPSPTNQD